jgi:hypothetical protein
MGTDENRNIDMICQHNADGTIIPLKIRMLDDDGAYQEYKVKAYKDLRYKGDFFEMPDVGKVHTSGIYPFQIRIECFGHERTVRIFYNSYEYTWKLIEKA